jgi:hypothetical protein
MSVLILACKCFPCQRSQETATAKGAAAIEAFIYIQVEVLPPARPKEKEGGT